MTRAKLIVASAAAALVGCGLTADFSGLQGGLPAAESFDASLATIDAAGLEAGAGVEASGYDASELDVGDMPTSYCAMLSPAPKLCADFDESDQVGIGWTLFDTSNGQQISVDTGNSYSPPASFLSVVTAGNGTPESARLAESLPVLSSHVHASFDILLPDGGGPFEIFAVHELTSDGNTYGLFFKQEEGDILIYVDVLEPDGGLDSHVYPLGAPPAGWFHMDIQMDIADSGNVVVTENGNVVVDAIGIATSTDDRTQLFVELGFYCPDDATASANFDDVVLDWP